MTKTGAPVLPGCPERERELSVLKTRFFSMASHEFRTPLSTVLAASQLMENSPSIWNQTAKRERNLKRIQDAVKNMVQLLDDILTIFGLLIYQNSHIVHNLASCYRL